MIVESRFVIERSAVSNMKIICPPLYALATMHTRLLTRIRRHEYMHMSVVAPPPHPTHPLTTGSFASVVVSSGRKLVA